MLISDIIGISFARVVTKKSLFLNFHNSRFNPCSVDLYRYVSGTRYRTNLFSIWQHGENAANKSLESHSGDGVGLRRTRM